MSNTLGIKNKLLAKTSMDDFFSSEEMRNGTAEEIITVDISLLDDYKHHTFDIRPDDHPEMQELIHSIHLHGQITPGIVRPSPYEDGRYEIIKGHQTRHALEINGFNKMKVIVRNLTDDEADIQMAETNIARPDISYMEKARTYKRVHDATVHQGKKADGMTNENLTKIFGDSARNINRYLRLNELNEDFQTLVDVGTISFNAAVELSYLSFEAQKIVFKSIDERQSYPSIHQAQELRRQFEAGELTIESVDALMNQLKGNQKEQYKIKRERIVSYLPSRLQTNKDVEEYIIAALKAYAGD